MRWIAFPLHPETPDEGLSLEELFAGRDINIAQMLEHLGRVASELSLPFGERRMTFNSRRAQELSKWAELCGRGDDYHKAVFRAYFVEGLNIAAIPVLLEIAKELGLDQSEAREVLVQGSYKAEVDRDWLYSRANGINAVPTFMVGGTRLVGAQPYPALSRLVTDAAGRR